MSGNPISRGERGFTYLAAMLAVAFLGVALAAAGTVWRTAQQRDNERELLFVGNEFRQAIGRYYERTPGTVKKYPPNLEVLLADERFPTPQRHLRKIYPDPITNRREWGLVPGPEGGVAGVYSRSEAAPWKQANFPQRDEAFAGATKYSDWRFVYLPGAAASAPAGGKAPAAVAPALPAAGAPPAPPASP